MVEVVYGRIDLIPSYYECLKQVASERTYIEMLEPPPLETVTGFQTGLIQKEGPLYYAVLDKKVVGWCDIFPAENPRQKHRGSLGMGLLADFRGKGFGSLLLAKTLEKAKAFGLEKVELNVYTTNTNAIALYKKHGFFEEGLIKHYRKLDGKYFDSLSMGKFL
jgi:ribosomal protein S18 acetylase RimI-like enzyme